MLTSPTSLLSALRVSRRRRRLRDASLRGARKVFSGALEIGFDAAVAYAHDVIIRRQGTGFAITLSPQDPALSLRHDPPRLPAYLYWLKHCSPAVRQISVTLADGDRPSAAIFAPSTYRPDVVALPDPLFFNTHGYAAERVLSLGSALPWDARSTDLVWRGGMNGFDSFDLDVARQQPQRASQRLLACLALHDVPGTDVKFTRARHRDISRFVFQRSGLAGGVIESGSWLGRKYALDVDGFSNAWTNLFTRLLFGCCVLKVASRWGFRQWYYDRLVPWEHYVPVAADLSDIHDRLDWVRSNDRQASEIAQRGRRLALGLTMSAATGEAVALIEANWRPERG